MGSTDVELRYVCGRCGKEMHPEANDGCVYVGEADMKMAQEAETRKVDANERQSIPLAECLSQWQKYPRAQWQVAHYACCKDDPDHYHIKIGELGTYRQLVKWTAHLFAKPWFHLTAWHRFLYHTHDANPG